MKKSDLTFGVACNDPSAVRTMILSHVSIEFENRYSDFLGGDYLYGERNGEQVRLVRNLDGGEPAEIEYAHLGSLIQIDSTTQSNAWKLWAQKLGIALIRENEY